MAENSSSDEPELPLGPFFLTPTRLAVRAAGGGPPLEEWGGPLRFALWCQQGAPWWIGDLLNAGDARFGEMFSQVCEGAVSADQLQRYESVARRVPPENRRSGVASSGGSREPPSRCWQCLSKARTGGPVMA